MPVRGTEKPAVAPESAAVILWGRSDEIGEIFGEELQALGFSVCLLPAGQSLPPDLDVVITFGPYGEFLPVARQVGQRKSGGRPLFIHWNTELIPNPRLPWVLVRPLSILRAWMGARSRKLATRALRLRYLGDSHYAFRRGWLDLLVESSQVYTAYHRRHGLPAVFIPWGTSPRWFADLDLERDIDVLWMGKRRSKRRSDLLDDIQSGLECHGRTMWVADDQEKPLIYGAARTRLLNRSKVTLNLLSNWHDNALVYRFPMGAGNRSLVVSEPTLAHDENLVPGEHYVLSPPEHILETLLDYLQDAPARQPLVQAAYHLVTHQLAFRQSVRQLLQIVRERCAVE
jgi:hypothetical protein